MMPLDGTLLAEAASSSGRGVEERASLSSSSSGAQMTRSVVGEPGGVKAGSGGGPIAAGEPGGVKVGEGGGSARKLSSRWGFSIMLLTSNSSTSMPVTCDADKNVRPAQSLSGGLKNIEIVKILCFIVCPYLCGKVY